MARRRRADDERSMDSLMDALTNVVGILLLILIVSSLGISAAVKKVVENLPEVTQEELEAMKVSRDKTLKNLQELQITQQNTQENLPTEDEQALIKAEIDEIEKNNQDLADKTADIEEWKAKVEAEEIKKTENEEKVKTADARNLELAAILAQTPEVEVAEAKEVLMPNPRFAEENSRVLYLIAKNQKLYFVGNPYDHAFKIRDVIDQNFTDLAYTTQKTGSYTYALKGTKKDDNGKFSALTEDFNLTRTAEKDLAAWSSIKPTWLNYQKEIINDRNVVQLLFGNDDRKEFQVQKFRYDINKIMKFFGDGKLGPKDFAYHISKGGGDRVRFAVEPRVDAGWTPDQFLQQGSEFEALCKSASVNRGNVFYYFVASDSFDTYLQARAKSESYRVPAGWNTWNGEKLALQAGTFQYTTRYDLNSLPKESYRKLADSVGPYMVRQVSEEWEEFDDRITASVPEDMKDEKERTKFITTLTEERREFNRTKFQGAALNPFKAALAVSKVSGDEEVQIEIHPPEIPHIRVFSGLNPPDAPTPVVVKDTKIGEKPGGGTEPVGGNQLILD